MRMIPIPKIAGNYKQNYCKLGQILNVTGSIELKMDPAIRKMARELTRLLKMVKPLEEQAANICKDMSSLYSQMDDNFLKLSVVTAQIHKAYEKVASKFDFDHFTKVADLYKDLNTTFVDWGKVQKSATTNWFKNIRMMFAFSSQEEAGIQNVSSNLAQHKVTLKSLSR